MSRCVDVFFKVDSLNDLQGKRKCPYRVCGVVYVATHSLFPLPPLPHTQGFKRVYAEIADISIDVPNAYLYLERIVNRCYDLRIIDMKLKMKAPNRYLHPTTHLFTYLLVFLAVSVFTYIF